jgi:hypothetical protein
VELLQGMVEVTFSDARAKLAPSRITAGTAQIGNQLQSFEI